MNYICGFTVAQMANAYAAYLKAGYDPVEPSAIGLVSVSRWAQGNKEFPEDNSQIEFVSSIVSSGVEAFQEKNKELSRQWAEHKRAYAY